MARHGIYQKLERLLIKSFVYICEGLVLVHRHFMKPRNVKCNIFSELTQNASLQFFRKKINGNCNRKILRDNGKLKPNFVLKILFGKILCEIKNWNQTLRKIENRTKLCGLTLRWFFSSWKYNTAFNSGLH